MIRAPIIAFIIALVAGLWIASGYYDFADTSASVKDDPATIEMSAGTVADAMDKSAQEQDSALPHVQVINSVAILRVREIKLFGRTEPDRTVEVSAETSGKVTSLKIVEGAVVDKGNVILRLSMDSRKVKLEEAKARLKFQEISYAAAEKLSKKKFESEVKLAELFANLESSKSDLAIAELDIARVRIKAPFKGIVEKILLEVGDYVRVGDAVAHIVDLDPIVVAVQVTERAISQVEVGQNVIVQFLSGEVQNGTVGYISRSASTDTRTFRVEVKLENPDYRIPDGMTANVTMLTNPVSAHKISPAVLTLDDNGAIGVKSVNANNQVMFHKISIIADTVDGIWIGGLPENVSLITIGQEFVKVGQTVEPFRAG